MRVCLRHNRIGLSIAVAALLAACSTAPRNSEARVTGGPGDRLGHGSGSRCRPGRSWPGTGTVRRGAAGGGANGVDDVGVGPPAQAEARRHGRPTACCWYPYPAQAKSSACIPPTTDRRSRCCSTGSTNLTDWPSQATHCMSPKAIRSMPTTMPMGERRIDARSPVAYPMPKAPISEARTLTRSRASPSVRTVPCTSRSARRATSAPRTVTPTRRARPSCGFRPAADRRNRSPQAYATAPAWRSPPMGRYGPRSTTVTTSPIRGPVNPTPNTSTSIRPNRLPA